MVWAWRARPSGSDRTPLTDRFLLDTRNGPGAEDIGVVGGFIEVNPAGTASIEVGAHYQSGSFYNAYGNQDLQKFEINTDNLKTIRPDTSFNTGSQSFPSHDHKLYRK